MSSNYTVQIDENDCIGDSLVTINSNFANLDTRVSSLSTLNDNIVAFHCERNGGDASNEAGQLMSFGSGSSTGGIVMPLRGRIVAASLRVNSLANGVIEVVPQIREPIAVTTTGSRTNFQYGTQFTNYTSDDYRMRAESLPGATTSFGVAINWPRNRQLSFNPGATIAWLQREVSGTVGSYQVTFYVYFTP